MLTRPVQLRIFHHGGARPTSHGASHAVRRNPKLPTTHIAIAAKLRLLIPFLQSLGKRRIRRITIEMADPALPLFFHNKWKGPEKDRWHFAPLLPPVMT